MCGVSDGLDLEAARTNQRVVGAGAEPANRRRSLLGAQCVAHTCRSHGLALGYVYMGGREKGGDGTGAWPCNRSEGLRTVPALANSSA